MRKLFISTLLLACFSCNNSVKYFDGEGNEIPQKAVSLLVKSQFVLMTAKEDSTINQYFYFRKINADIDSLISEGYSKRWAIKKALVENNVIKPNAEYFAIIND